MNENHDKFYREINDIGELREVAAKLSDQNEFLNQKNSQKHEMCRELTVQNDIALDTLIGIFELAKQTDQEDYGNSYKARCLDQKTRLEAIKKGARKALFEMGYTIEGGIAPKEDNTNQMDLFK